MAACYRHPGNETNVSCSSCGRPICPDCMHPTPVGMRCPDCASQTTEVRHMRAMAEPRLFEVAPVTAVLIGVNVAVFAADLALGGGVTQSANGGLTADGKLYGPLIGNGEWWRLLTGGFLHSGVMHLGLNMFVLYMLGMMLEPVIGRARFGLIYLIALLAGSLGSLLLSPLTPVVGASGAVFGLMGAAVVAGRARGVDPFASGLGGLLALNLLITFLIPGIAIGGHLGGLAGGALAGLLLIELDQSRRVFGRSPVGAIALGVVLAVAVFAAGIAAGESGLSRLLTEGA